MSDLVKEKLALHLVQSLSSHYCDINDIDFQIMELNKKRKHIARRMESDATELRSLLDDTSFVNSLYDELLSDCKESLDGIDELVEIVKNDIKG